MFVSQAFESNRKADGAGANLREKVIASVCAHMGTANTGRQWDSSHQVLYSEILERHRVPQLTYDLRDDPCGVPGLLFALCARHDHLHTQGRVSIRKTNKKD